MQRIPFNFLIFWVEVFERMGSEESKISGGLSGLFGGTFELGIFVPYELAGRWHRWKDRSVAANQGKVNHVRGAAI